MYVSIIVIGDQPKIEINSVYNRLVEVIYIDQIILDKVFDLITSDILYLLLEPTNFSNIMRVVDHKLGICDFCYKDGNNWCISKNLLPDWSMSTDILIPSTTEINYASNLLTLNNNLPIVNNKLKIYHSLDELIINELPEYWFFIFLDYELLPLVSIFISNCIKHRLYPIVFYYDDRLLPYLQVYPIILVNMKKPILSLNEMYFEKLHITYNLLKTGKIVMYSDIDIIMLSHNLQSLVEKLRRSSFDMFIQSTPSLLYCTGFYVIRSNKKTVDAFQIEDIDINKYFGGDQHYFNDCIAAKLSIDRLSPWSYPNGLIYRRDLHIKPELVHFNWNRGTDKKLYLMQELIKKIDI